MTFQPTKLDSLSDSLDAEVKSAEILLSRLKSLAPEEDGDEGDGGAGRDKRAVRVERLKRAERAERVVKGYISWLADPSKEFEVDSHISREDAPERDREVQDIIDEVVFRQRYISNQLTLLALKSRKRKTKTTGSRIEKLQSYNEIKDVAQELMGLVAENRGVMVGRLYEGQEFGVSAED